MKFKLSYFDGLFEIYIKTMGDLAVLEEVFLLMEYDWELNSSPKVIIDLGAHYGDTALFYHLKYPDATIFALEPAPDTFQHLCMNVKSIPQIKPIQLGIAGTNGSKELHISPSSFGSSFTDRGDKVTSVLVPVSTLESFFDTYDIARADLIKFDIEGAEDSLFISGSPEDFADAYIGEVHEDLMEGSPEDFLSKFEKFHYQKEKLASTKRFILKATR